MDHCTELRGEAGVLLCPTLGPLPQGLHHLSREGISFSPYFTGGGIECPASEETINALKTAFKGLDDAVLNMRVKMSLRTEYDALDKFRATMTNPEKFKRYLRVDSESPSMLIAKVTLTTCYGIPVKGEPGYIPDDENVPVPTNDGKQKITPWEEIDPIGTVRIPHHSEKGYVIIDEGLINDETGDGPASAHFRDVVQAIGPETKARADEDIRTEDEFFGLVKNKIPRRRKADPAFMRAKHDVFEALPEELEIYPDSVTDTPTPRSSPPIEARSPIAPTRRNDPRPARAVSDSQRPAGGDDRMGGSDDPPPPSREMPPPRAPASKRTGTPEGGRPAHSEGDVLVVSGWNATGAQDEARG